MSLASRNHPVCDVRASTARASSPARRLQVGLNWRATGVITRCVTRCVKCRRLALPSGPGRQALSALGPARRGGTARDPSP